MRRFAFGVALLALGAAACSAPEPPSASTTAAEIAALEKQLREPPVARPADPALAPPVAQGSPAFARQADEAMRLVDGKLGGAAPKRDEAQYDADVADSRKALTDLRSAASTQAEKNVAILLTAMMVKQRERHLILLTKPQEVSEVRALERSSTECLAEAEEWIKAIRGEVEILEVGRCLQETQEALRQAQN